MFESYHPDTGEPNLFPGFLSWNLLAIELCGHSNPEGSLNEKK